MTCHDALERLLVADLSTDGSVDDPVLNSHLKHCAQCSAVASQLRSDTRLLAAAVVSPRELRSPVGAPRRLSFALPVLAVAAIAVFVVARSRPSDGSGTLVATSVAGAVADASERPPQTAEGARGVSQPSPNVPRRVTSARRTQESPRVVAASLGDDLRRAITPFTATPFVPERTFVAAAALETPQPVNHADAARGSDGSGTLVATSVAGAVADASERPTQTAEGARGVSQPSPNVPRGVPSAERTLETPRVVAASLGDDLRRAITPFTATPFVPERTIVAAAAIETPQPINHADAARVPVFSVDPKVGARAMVARTADPRITVVWLY